MYKNWRKQVVQTFLIQKSLLEVIIIVSSSILNGKLLVGYNIRAFRFEPKFTEYNAW